VKGNNTNHIVYTGNSDVARTNGMS
jgi:hypothetical protein